MLSLVLGRLEALQADLAAIDPTREVDAADSVAAMAVELRRLVVDAVTARPTRDDLEVARAAIMVR
jgi:hypothetical protein